MDEIVKPRTRDLSRLARDIAMDILKLDDVLQLHQVEREDWEKIAQTAAFRAMLDQMRADWLSAGNTKERVRIKAQTGIEAILEDLISDSVDREIPLAQRVECAKLLTKLGDLGESRPEGAGAERVTIQINVGPTAQTIEAKAVPSRDAEDVVHLTTK